MTKKKLKKRLIALSLAAQMFVLSGCGKSVDNSEYNHSEQEIAAGEHLILKVDRSYDMFLGKEGKYGLTAPEGYRVLDYDYDYSSSTGFQFDDYVFINDEPVIVKNPNNVGIPVNSTKELSEKKIYKPGEHVIVDINRTLSIWFGKNDTTMALSAPVGYEVIDYDYDKTDSLSFENITYANTVDVEVTDINDFGKPVEKEETKSYYDIGEHKIVAINRSFNPFWGKDEMKSLTAPKGYRIVDYDYDKNESHEFETITYENIVPVIAKDPKEFGTILEGYELEDSNIGNHVLVDINRNMSIAFGFEGTERLIAKEGYEVLDYDYDKNEDFEFETTVYANDEEVEVIDPNNFGKVLKKTK